MKNKTITILIIVGLIVIIIIALSWNKIFPSTSTLIGTVPIINNPVKNPPVQPTQSTSDVGKIAYANADGVQVYNQDGSVYKSAKQDEWVGTVNGITIPNYLVSGNRTVAIQDVYLVSY